MGGGADARFAALEAEVRALRAENAEMKAELKAQRAMLEKLVANGNGKPAAAAPAKKPSLFGDDDAGGGLFGSEAKPKGGSLFG